MAMAYRAMGLKTGMLSSELNTKVEALIPPPIPVMRPPTRQPASRRG